MLRQSLQKHSLLYSNPSSPLTIFFGTVHNRIPVAIKERRHSSLALANESIEEAMTQARLDHQNVCRVYGCFLEQSNSNDVKAVIVEELMVCDFQRLITDRRTRQSRWSEADLLWILCSLALALDFAQSKGIAHRDLKPKSVFVDDRGRVKLGNFTSSTLYWDKLQADNRLRGTVLFLSPELKVKLVDTLTGSDSFEQCDPYQSDVYSLAVTMLYLGSLTPPTSLLDLNSPHATEDSLASLDPYSYLQSVLKPMLKRQPGERPSFASVMGECLESLSRIEVVEGKDCFARKCCVCREVVLSRDWQDCVGSDFPRFQPFLSILCSVACLRKLSESYNRSESQPCLQCNYNITLEISSLAPVIRLECGHFLHNRRCFQDLIAITPIRSCCPKCNAQISDAFIEKVLSSSVSKELASTKRMIYCDLCELCANVTMYGGCGHKICDKCGFGMIKRLFLQKCKVCRVQKSSVNSV